MFILCSVAISHAKESIVLSVDSTNLVIGQSTNLSITISNVSTSEKPEIKNISDFNISYIGTSSSISIINGSFKSNKTYTYILVPLKKGKFTIGPAVLTSKGKVYKSNTVVISVSDRPVARGKKENKNIFLVVNANKSNVKLNEEVILDVKLYRRIELYNMRIKVPDLNEFLITKLTNAQEYIEPFNGIKYYVDELKYSLIPTETGKFTIPPFILYGEKPLSDSPVGGFFKNPFIAGETKQISVPSNSLKITVNQLKDNVYAVGDSSFSCSIDKDRVKVGESITFTFKISGSGDLNFSQNLKLPKIKGLKYYPDKPKVSVKSSKNGLISSKIEKIAIIPEKSGFYKISKLKILFYNPRKNKYERFFLPKISFDVFASNKSKLKVVESNNKNQSKSQEVTSEETIDTIITNQPIENQMIFISFYKILIFYIIPIIILIVSYLLRYSYLIRRANYKKIIQSNAFNNFKKFINQTDDIEQISNGIKKYFSEKTGNIEHSYTFKEIILILEKYEIEKSIIEKLQGILSNIEKVQFAKSGNIDIQLIKNEIIRLIDKIDKKMRFK